MVVVVVGLLEARGGDLGFELHDLRFPLRDVGLVALAFGLQQRVLQLDAAQFGLHAQPLGLFGLMRRAQIVDARVVDHGRVVRKVHAHVGLAHRDVARRTRLAFLKLSI